MQAMFPAYMPVRATAEATPLWQCLLEAQCTLGVQAELELAEETEARRRPVGLSKCLESAGCASDNPSSVTLPPPQSKHVLMFLKRCKEGWSQL